jgi:hypothetical protein
MRWNYPGYNYSTLYEGPEHEVESSGLQLFDPLRGSGTGGGIIRATIIRPSTRVRNMRWNYPGYNYSTLYEGPEHEVELSRLQLFDPLQGYKILMIGVLWT